MSEELKNSQIKDKDEAESMLREVEGEVMAHITDHEQLAEFKAMLIVIRGLIASGHPIDKIKEIIGVLYVMKKQEDVHESQSGNKNVFNLSNQINEAVLKTIDTIFDNIIGKLIEGKADKNKIKSLQEIKKQVKDNFSKASQEVQEEYKGTFIPLISTIDQFFPDVGMNDSAIKKLRNISKATKKEEVKENCNSIVEDMGKTFHSKIQTMQDNLSNMAEKSQNMIKSFKNMFSTLPKISKKTNKNKDTLSINKEKKKVSDLMNDKNNDMDVEETFLNAYKNIDMHRQLEEEFKKKRQEEQRLRSKAEKFVEVIKPFINYSLCNDIQENIKVTTKFDSIFSDLDNDLREKLKYFENKILGKNPKNSIFPNTSNSLIESLGLTLG